MKSISILALVLALVPAVAGDSAYYLRLATLALIYMAWTVAFNLIFGHAVSKSSPRPLAKARSMPATAPSRRVAS